MMEHTKRSIAIEEEYNACYPLQAALANAFLAFWNNYLTPAVWADINGFDTAKTNPVDLVNECKRAHEKRVAHIKFTLEFTTDYL